MLFIWQVFFYKVQWVVLMTLQVKSWSGSCNEIWILYPFSKAAEKTWIMFCFGYWALILDCDSAVTKKSGEKIQWLAMFCFSTLPLARPAQAKVQMLTTSSWSISILLKSLLKSFKNVFTKLDITVVLLSIATTDT